MSPVVIAVLIATAVFCLAAVLIIPKLLGLKPVEWTPLPGFANAKAVMPEGVPLVRVASALQQAAFALAEHGPWRREDVMAAADRTFVVVMAAEKWRDSWGRTVGGMSWPDGTIQVGLDLSALCHELAHHCERLIDKKTDDHHASWVERGIWTADNDYRAWLGT